MKTKHCTKCKKVNPVSEFCKSKAAKDGLYYWCKSCCRLAEKAWIAKQEKGYAKKYRIKNRYGITLEQHKEMYVNQDGCCAICNQSVSYEKIFTDHNHTTGKVRALLCNRCNTMLGHIECCPELITPMLDYLKEKK